MSLIGNNQCILQEEYTSSFLSCSATVTYLRKYELFILLRETGITRESNGFNWIQQYNLIFKAEQPRHTACFAVRTKLLNTTVSVYRA